MPPFPDVTGSAEPNRIARIYGLAQAAVNAARTALQTFLPVTFRLGQVDAAKTLSFRMDAAILDIETALIAEASAELAAKTGETPALPTMPEGTELGAGRSRVSAQELN